MPKTRKLSRLQTWERSVLLVASCGKIFSANSLYLELSSKVYPDITIIDVTRALASLVELGYLEVNERDPYFDNRSSYICSPSGLNYQAYCHSQESKLWLMIMQLP